MLCSECVKTLYSNLSGEARTIIEHLALLYDDQTALNQGEIIKLTGLSISVARDALNELRGAMMVTATVRGRGIYYALAEGVVEALESETMGAEETMATMAAKAAKEVGA